MCRPIVTGHGETNWSQLAKSMHRDLLGFLPAAVLRTGNGTCSESDTNLLGTVSTWLTMYRPFAPGTSAARMWARATSRTSQ